jgi:hypothetical protein
MISNIYEYMHNLPVQGVTEAVDALTVTATGLDGKMSIQIILNELRDETEAERKKLFRFQGAAGWSAGSVRYAEKFDTRHQKLWSILMVAGQGSEKALKMAIRTKDVKYTRIDLCVDVVMSSRVLGIARKLKDTYKGRHNVKLIESDTGDTLYVGSREAESMLRIYDKSAFYGEELGHVWRFEVEYKRGLARGAAEYVEEEGLQGISDAIWSDCRAKDIPCPVPGRVVRLKRQVVTLTSAEMKINWLSRQVAPTVRHLISLGLKSEVAEAIQLKMEI